MMQMEKWPQEWMSNCLNCGDELAVSAVPITGEIFCQKCGAANVFNNSQKPDSKRGGRRKKVIK